MVELIWSDLNKSEAEFILKMHTIPFINLTPLLIARHMKLSYNHVILRLSELKFNGLVTSKKLGRNVYYRKPGKAAVMKAWLKLNSDGEEPNLDGFREWWNTDLSHTPPSHTHLTDHTP